MGSLKATSTRNDRGFLSRQNGDRGGGGGQHPVSQGPRGAVEKASTRQIFPQSCLPLVPGHISRSPRETKESVKVPGPLGWWLRALVLGFGSPWVLKCPPLALCIPGVLFLPWPLSL